MICVTPKDCTTRSPSLHPTSFSVSLTCLTLPNPSNQEKVLDKKTRVVILKMVNSGLVTQVNGVVSSGKESVIIHCNGGRLVEVRTESLWDSRSCLPP